MCGVEFDLDMLVVQLGNIPKFCKVLSISEIEHTLTGWCSRSTSQMQKRRRCSLGSFCTWNQLISVWANMVSSFFSQAQSSAPFCDIITPYDVCAVLSRVFNTSDDFSTLGGSEEIP